MVKIKVFDGKIVKLPKATKQEGSKYFDGLLATNLDDVKQIISADWDFFWLIDGIEGGGKSWFAQQLAWYCTNGNFGIEDVCFTSEDFKKRIKTQEKYKAVIWDESFRGLSGRARLSRINKEIVEVLAECRQRNLFVFIVLPSIWELDNYAKLHRAKGLFHIYTDEKWQRGHWKFYKNKDKGSSNYFKKFFTESKNRYSYPKFPNLKGRFGKWLPIDENQYKKKKEKSFGMETYKQPVIREEQTALRWKQICVDMKNWVKRNTKVPLWKFYEDIGVNKGTMHHLGGEIRRMKVNNLKIEGRSEIKDEMSPDEE